MYKNKDYHKEYYERNKEKYKKYYQDNKQARREYGKTITRVIILVIKKDR